MLEYIYDKVFPACIIAMFLWIGWCFEALGEGQPSLIAWLMLIAITIILTVVDLNKGIKTIEEIRKSERIDIWNTNMIFLTLFNPLFQVDTILSLIVSAIGLFLLIKSMLKDSELDSDSKWVNISYKLVLLFVSALYIYSTYLHYEGNEIIGSFWSKQKFHTKNAYAGQLVPLLPE